MNSSVSVVIPTFNGSAFIGDALESACQQSLPPREVIVVDDASTDDTCDVVRSFQKETSLPVQLVERQTNSGCPGVPICVGVKAARGDLIAVLDQDDVHLPRTLQEHQEALQAMPACTMSFSLGALMSSPESPMVSEDISGQLKDAAVSCDGVLHIPGTETIRLLLSLGNFVRGFPGFVFRRSSWHDLEDEASRWRIAFDLVVLRELLLQGGACFIPSIGYLRRQHDTNATRQVIRVLEELLRFSDETVAEGLACLATDQCIRQKHRSWRHQLAEESRRSEPFRTSVRRHVNLLRTYGRDATISRSLVRLLSPKLPANTKDSLRRVRVAISGSGRSERRQES
jgi:glycosyltransferase involved in cell wall biosynthesis